jgi:hypothetical protein
MRRLLLAILVLGLAVAPSGAADAAAPALRVQGNRLVDAAGAPVRLLGVNRSGSEYACIQGWSIFDGPVDDAAVRAIAAWNTTAVRVPLNEDCWLGQNTSPRLGGEAYRAAIEGFVGRLNAAGLVAILDLHWSGPGKQPATGQSKMADAVDAPAFWSSVATRFRDNPAVVFDLYNEPHGVSWSCWRDGCSVDGYEAAGMQRLVDAVRATGARQPLMLTGLAYGNDLSQWLAHRPADPVGALVAGFHLYNFNACVDTACWDRTVAPVAAQVPVVTGELGENDCSASFITRYMDWADGRGVSYLGWAWNPYDCGGFPALISSYDGTPTPFGAGLRDRLRSATGVRLEYRTGDTAAQDRHLRPHLRLTGGGALAEVTIRYWYTVGGSSREQARCDAGCGNVTTRLGRVDRQGANAYLEVGFTGGQDATGDLQLRVTKTGGGSYDETDDWSYDRTKTAHAPWDRVTVYRNGRLIAGSEPPAR